MDKVYIAINGDNVGESIGSAIASDDQETLGSTTSTLKQIHQQIDSWVEDIGGEVVVSSGDEGVYAVPGEALEYLEDLRQQYAEFTGHTLTIGIGSSMSEASKALIYGKLTDKNQIVEYDQEIEEAIRGELADEEPVGPEGYEQQYERDLPAEEEMQYQRDRARQEEIGEEEDIIAEDELESEADEDELEEDPEQIIEDATGEMPGKHSKEPEHEMDMTPEEEAEHDEAEQEADEMDEDVIEADEETMDEGIDGDTDDPEDANVDEFEEEEMPEEDESDHDAMLAEMVYSQMEGEEMPEEEMMEEEMPEETDGMQLSPEEEQAMQQLKGDITSSLQAFKQYKQLIEETQASHPDFYNAMIVMLRSMVGMAKMLNFNPEEGLEETPEEQAMQEQAMQQEQMPEEEMYAKSEKPEKK